MSIVYLMGALIVVMVVVLGTLFIKPSQRYTGYIALLAPIMASSYFIYHIPIVLKEQYPAIHIPWMSSIDINVDLRLDGLGLMFGLIISLIGVAVFSTRHSTLLLEKIIYLGFYLFIIIYVCHVRYCCFQ